MLRARRGARTRRTGKQVTPSEWVVRRGRGASTGERRPSTAHPPSTACMHACPVPCPLPPRPPTLDHSPVFLQGLWRWAWLTLKSLISMADRKFLDPHGRRTTPSTPTIHSPASPAPYPPSVESVAPPRTAASNQPRAWRTATALERRFRTLPLPRQQLPRRGFDGTRGQMMVRAALDHENTQVLLLPCCPAAAACPVVLLPCCPAAAGAAALLLHTRSCAGTLTVHALAAAPETRRALPT